VAGKPNDLQGTISLAGLKVNERQTWIKISEDEFHILYEEQLRDKSWFISEENIYQNKKIEFDVGQLIQG
jgi:hypothetical protein